MGCVTMNNIRGKRGGSKNRSSRKPFKREESHNVSISQAVVEAGKYYDCFEGEETEETHLIPRKSLTRQQHLRLFPPVIETEARKARQLDKRSGNMVETTDQRLVWKSDHSLLRSNKPQVNIGTFRRITSRSKVRRIEKEEPAVIEVPTDTDLDIDLDSEG